MRIGMRTVCGMKIKEIMLPLSIIKWHKSCYETRVIKNNSYLIMIVEMIWRFFIVMSE